MMRRELIERLQTIRLTCASEHAVRRIDSLIEDIELDGVLDVQCPPDLAAKLNLDRPA